MGGREGRWEKEGRYVGRRVGGKMGGRWAGRWEKGWEGERREGGRNSGLKDVRERGMKGGGKVS